MADGDLPGGDPKGTPQGDGSKPVSQEDLDKFRSAYDKIIGEQSKKLDEAGKAMASANAEIALLKEGASEDSLKIVTRERELRNRELTLGEAEKKTRETEHKLAARELAAEAKASWGLDVPVDDLVKLADKGEMAIAVMRLVTKAQPQKPKSQAIPLKGGGIPPTTRYGTSEMSAALEEFLRQHNAI